MGSKGRMNLVIDLGNSYGKIAVCEGMEIIESAIYPAITIKEIGYFITAYPSLKGAIFSSVANHSREIIDFLGGEFKYFLELNTTTPIPLKNLYKTPETLGYDRIAAVTGAYTIFPGSNVLVIDAGTAITYDVVTDAGEYLGGSISPGLSMRFKALHRFTNRLPKVEPGEEKAELIGVSTKQAIASGVINGILFEIEGTISAVCEQFKEVKVVMTGGDAKSFDKKVKNSIFVHSHLNLIGLNRILDHNAEISHTSH